MAPALGIGGDPLPVEMFGADAVGDSLSSWMGTLDQTGAFDAVSNALPFGAREEVQTFIRDKFFRKFLPWLQEQVVAGGGSITEIAERLDDPDGDGNPGLDVFGLAGIDLDVTGDVQPKLPSTKYDITFTIKGKVALDPDLALHAGDLALGGQTTDGTAQIAQTVKLHLDLTKPEPSAPAHHPRRGPDRLGQARSRRRLRRHRRRRQRPGPPGAVGSAPAASA